MVTKLVDDARMQENIDKTKEYVKDNAVIQVTTMPTASSTLAGKVYQYIGTTGTYTHGYFYECKSSGSGYEWVNVPLGSSDISAYHTDDTAETTIADGDYFPFYDTSASGKRKSLWSNIKSVLKTYFDGIYLTSHQDITGKADKVTSATNGHLAGLDSNGNLTDSGKSSLAVIPSGGTTGQVLKKSSGTDYAVEWGNESGGGHTILNGSGSAMNQRSKLQFEGMGVTDDSTNDRTKVKLPIFNGTTAQWEALSSSEKAKYTVVNLTDDYGDNTELLKDTGELFVKTNSNYDATNKRYYISTIESTGQNIQYLINRYSALVMYVFTGGSANAMRLSSYLVYDTNLYNNYTYINMESNFSNGGGFSWNVCGYGQYYRASNGNATTEVALSSVNDDTNSYMRLVVKGIRRG